MSLPQNQSTNLENRQGGRGAGLTKDDWRILLAVTLLGKLEPVGARRWKDAERTSWFDQGQVPGVTDAAAMLGPAVMRMGRGNPGSLRRQRAVPNQEYEQQFPKVGERASHLFDYSRERRVF